MSNKQLMHSNLSKILVGVFSKQFGVDIATEVANSVVSTGKVGEINIKLKVSKLADSQVQVESKLSFNEPLAKGKRVEEHNEKTPMHVNLGGDVSFRQAHRTF
jgi:hypothetical protein